MKPLFPTLLFSLLLLCFGSVVRAADLTIVENGQPRAEIVVAEKRPRMVPMAGYIEIISGVAASH